MLIIGRIQKGKVGLLIFSIIQKGRHVLVSYARFVTFAISYSGLYLSLPIICLVMVEFPPGLPFFSAP